MSYAEHLFYQPASKPLSQDKKDKIFQNFVITLFRYYQKERTLPSMPANNTFLPGTFLPSLKRNQVVHALQWIVQMVITEAKQLLENSDLTIKEIATKTEFPRLNWRN